MDVQTESRSTFNLPSISPFPFSLKVDFQSTAMIGSTELQPTTVIHRDPESKSTVSMIEGDAPQCAQFRKTAALKVQKVYRSYRTRRRLADSAVVAEELWWQVIDYFRLNHSTTSFYDDLNPESPHSRWNRVSLNASKIDPRHRYGHNLHKYFKEWCKGNAGQPFFYWLDIGDGRDIDLKDCSRTLLRQQFIKYLGPKERERNEYIIFEGKIVHKQTGELIDTSKGSDGCKWIFVMSTSKRLYAGEKKKGTFHHSSFLAGGATLAAGRFIAKNGMLKAIWAYSGHYRPTDENINSFLSFLRENGVNLNEIQIHSSFDEDYCEDGKAVQEKMADVPTITQSPQHEIPCATAEVIVPSEPTKDAHHDKLLVDENRGSYLRTLSGGLQSPRAEVPKKAVLQRINSKKAVKSYQLGHQLSLKWSTGAGPRIGCVADYPLELRVQALEFVNLSPRAPPTPSTAQKLAALIPPTSASSMCLHAQSS
ncbi:IQ domain-containing protein IQM3-like isoform X2 [Magnolia sinica]|uniref:IQ domain-containing protein IQM3-like isoform X2 n=1 Tax=Magnolia sinica TaxID=86752 RepID=UPI002657AEED|nr:IQ domain-containing protein IQM3-like isoform X2 [Magnolia sinica]